MEAEGAEEPREGLAPALELVGVLGESPGRSKLLQAGADVGGAHRVLAWVQPPLPPGRCASEPVQLLLPMSAPFKMRAVGSWGFGRQERGLQPLGGAHQMTDS